MFIMGCKGLLENFWNNQNIEYREFLINLARKDLKEAIVKLRYDSCYPMMDCKKFLHDKLKEIKMKVVYAQEEITHYASPSIFLAGPTPRDINTPSWRPLALQLLEKANFNGVVFVPEFKTGPSNNFEYNEQIQWEHTALELADKILFWIPRELTSMPAFTTNIEFGYWMCKNPNKIYVGAPDNTPKMDYIKYYSNVLNIPYYNDLEIMIYETTNNIV